ncbi:hypothetical protein MIZ03_1401 [Rhodoferax lithotrophicus]|uniref:Uncharacterized protein n=1 Tax=Rhodoferax lithotrophicus TaxID=2798804 RepID=A0ABM7MJX1_9BURK|nr:hypothetical protein MIZ03_1401 [Rhodoferax sp. MIZ03]
MNQAQATIKLGVIMKTPMGQVLYCDRPMPPAATVSKKLGKLSV